MHEMTIVANVLKIAHRQATAAHAARIRVALEAAGTPIGPHDTLIAATALRHQAALVTRNVREFSRVQGLQWLSWHETI